MNYNENNPFSVTFGKEPKNYINRLVQENQIIKDFEQDIPVSQIYLITGVRGSGKTVMLSNITKHFSSKTDWIIVDLNPERDLLESLAAKLYDNAKIKHLFLNMSFSFSFHGIGLNIKGEKPISDVESLLDIMLSELKKNNKKVLITIDEVTNNQSIKTFAHTFQGFMRKDYAVCLLMTGLYENLNKLENEKTLTFLYRAPKITLQALSIQAISNSYQNIFELDMDEGNNLARLTNGYAFAYQVLGFLMWNRKSTEISKDLLSLYDQYLEEYVYEKMYSELSKKEIALLNGMSSNVDQVSILIKNSQFNKNEFSVYRDRLKKIGIINTDTFGVVKLALPRFYEFIQTKKILM